jgi:ABC-2 type transport system permease protein
MTRSISTILFSPFRKYAEIARVGMRQRSAYLANMLGSLATYAIFIFVFSRLWSAAYEGKQAIAGYGRDQVLWYFIVAELMSFGMGRFFWGLAGEIKEGAVAYTLTRPVSFIGQAYASKMGSALVDTGLLFAIGTALGFALAGPPAYLDPLRLPMLILMVTLAGTLQFFIHTLISMTAFVFEENSAFFWIYQKLILVVGTLVPIEFLPDWTRAIAAWTPFPYITWAPARFGAVPGVDPWPLLAGQAAWVAAAIIACAAAFKLVSRRLSVNGG